MNPSPCKTWQRALALLLATSLALPAPLLHAQVRLPALGESVGDDFSIGTERRLGEQIMREIRRDPDYLDDPVLLEYLQSLWQPLVAAARVRGDVVPEIESQFAWEAFLVRDRSVNAFALPGGYVGVHLGLIAITSSRDELASVLAHELAHVTQRHIARSVVNSQRASLVGLAGLLLGVFAAARSGSADAANAAIVGGQAVAAQGQLNFSRDMEREADRIGFGLLAQGEFVPSGMAAMFEKLDGASRLNDSNAFPYLRSHPLTIDRVSEARSRMLQPASVAAKPPLRHTLMQARARVLMDGQVHALRRQQQLLGAATATAGDLPARLGALYGGALASSLLGDHDQALSAVAQAQRLAQTAQPREPQAERLLVLLQAQALQRRGDPAAALQALDSPVAADGARPIMLLRAQALLDLQRQAGGRAAVDLRHSTETLQTWVAEHRQDAAAWELLSASADALGLRLRSLRAGAEARAALGDINGAIDRLRSAQHSTHGAAGQDFIEASVIDARLRQLQAQRRQLLADSQRGNQRSRDDPDARPL
ncbi:MAG: M48 family metalloprotease [Rubrivivax sp.]|nr:M48 family metalloprotease [Rubrivivax sp.]